MFKMLRFPKPFRFALASSLLTSLAVTPLPAGAQNSIVAPNLMIIFGNSRSMSRELDDVTWPDWTTASYRRFNDSSNNGAGALWVTESDAPTSKFQIAKKALHDIIWDSTNNRYNPISNNINFGFATFRQTFGFEAVAADLEGSDAYMTVFPKDKTIWTKPTQDKQDYGTDVSNFGVMQWGGLTHLGGFANLGSAIGYWPPTATQPATALTPTKGKSVIDDSSAKYVSLVDAKGIGGGIVSQFQHAGLTNWSYTTDINGNSVFNKAETTGSSSTRITWTLCTLQYISDGNFYRAIYIGDKSVPNSVQISLHGAWGYKWPTAAGTVLDTQGNWNCPLLPGTDATDPTIGNPVGGTIKGGQVWRKITDKEKGTGETIYFSGIATYNDIARNYDYGWFSGWSGETTFLSNPNPFNAGTTAANVNSLIFRTKANYPNIPANPAHASRAWSYKATGGQQTDANHMGVFLNLPEPTLGYRDQRSVIKSFMQAKAMNDSGLDYSPDTTDIHNLSRHIIANGKGISTSTNGWASNQSPLFDSLMGAYAYFKAYKAADTTAGLDSCRSNNILLFFDGRENARWDPASNVYAKPALVAARLLADLDVKTHVIILSSKQGDIDDANAIATAGGTGSARNVNDSTSLFEAFKAVVSSVAGEVLTAAPALPRLIPSAGAIAYAPSHETNPAAGHFYGYAVNNKGVVSSSFTWDAASLMTYAKRQSALKTNATNNSIVNFSSLRGVDFGTTDTEASTIVNYTIDPSYGSSATTDVYLSGRKYGSTLGIFSDQSMAPVFLGSPLELTYFTDSNYLSFSRTNTDSRPQRVLFPNDDGFLYSIDATTGQLAWAWMPRPLLSLVKSPSTFWQNGNMRGGITIVDAHDGTNYGTYVLGTAQSGAIHYALKLDASANLSKVTWLDQASNSKSPMYQTPVISYLTSSSSAYPYKAFANYITVNNTSNVSTLSVKEVTGTTAGSSQALGITQPVSSELFVDQNKGVGKLYFGDKGGTVRSMPTANTAATAVSGMVTIGDHYDTTNKEVLYTGFQRWNDKDYVWAAGRTGITVFVYDTTSSSWKRLWESHVGGAGKWDISCNCTTRTADSTGTTASGTGIQSFPSGRVITARPIIEKGSLIVPVGQGSGTLSCTSGDGYYYLFRLDNGFFPTGRFQVVKSDGTTTALTGNLYIGEGRPKRPAVSTSSSGRFIFGTSEQPGASGQRMPALKVDVPTNSPVSWRELFAR